MLKNAVKEEALHLAEEEGKKLTRRALEGALAMATGKSRTPILSERQRKKLEREKKERQMKTILSVFFVLAAAGGLFAGVSEYLKDKKEKDRAVEDAQRKELYRKLAAIKGRI